MFENKIRYVAKVYSCSLVVTRKQCSVRRVHVHVRNGLEFVMANHFWNRFASLIVFCSWFVHCERYLPFQFFFVLQANSPQKLSSVSWINAMKDECKQSNQTQVANAKLLLREVSIASCGLFLICMILMMAMDTWSSIKLGRASNFFVSILNNATKKN